jgi:hypothetical protein
MTAPSIFTKFYDWKVQEKSCQIIAEVIYLTLIFTRRAEGGRDGAFPPYRLARQAGSPR